MPLNYRVIEVSENPLPSGNIELVETRLYDDGSETVARSLPYQRMFKKCSLCGLRSDKEEFPQSAIGCSRHDCLDTRRR